MSKNLHERVDELLAEADAASGAALSHDSDGDDSSAEPSLDETAQEASDLVESSDPQDLLAAVGLDTLPDGSEPDTLPEAIARGDPERVDDLKRLLNLAKLADRTDDGELDDAVGGLRESIETKAEDGTPASADGSAGDDRSTAESSGEETGPESDDEAEAEETETGDLEDRLRSALSDRFDRFGDDVSSLQERLEAAAADATGHDSSEEAAAEDEADEDTAAVDETDEESAGADDPEADETADDDGLLGTGKDLRSGPSDSSRHSTMAPPPSERADMRAVRRHSTMPDKN